MFKNDKPLLKAFWGIGNAWDTDLMARLSEALARKEYESSSEEALTPNFSIKTSPYGLGMSEDPYLCGQLAASFLKGAANGGIKPILSNCFLTQEDVDYMDLHPNKRVLCDYVVRPLKTALKKAECGVGQCMGVELEGAYEKANEFIERELDFAIDYSKPDALRTKEGKTRAEDLLEEAYQKSIVLMKNTDTLPIVSKERVALIGPYEQCSLDVQLQKTASLPFEYVGYAQGYSDLDKKDDRLLLNACGKAYLADVVVLIVAPSKSGGLRISANALALIDALKRSRIVAIVCDEVDMSFDEDCDSVVFAPDLDSDSAEFMTRPLVEIISGRMSPSGKLAFTFYDNPDEHFALLKQSKDFGYTKIGAFFGYRYYVSAKMKLKYPFGHGLSYSCFRYSKIRPMSGGISLLVSNVGEYDAHEIVQLYVGLKRSNILRPKMELKGFERVYLQSGQTKEVKIGLNYGSLGVYDYTQGMQKTEGGDYVFYVGASALDIKGRIFSSVVGDEIASTYEKPSDYFIESNIISGNYTLNKGVGRKNILRENEVELLDTPELESLFLQERKVVLAANDEFGECVIEEEIVPQLDLGEVIERFDEVFSKEGIGSHEELDEGFVALANECERAYNLSENMFKRLDKVLKWAHENCGLVLSNIQWRNFERFCSVYLACVAQSVAEAVVLDSAIAIRILPLILPKLNDGEIKGLVAVLKNTLAGDCVQSVKTAEEFRLNQAQEE